MSLKRFAANMKLRADRLGRNTNQLVKQVGAAVNQTVILATPVDTGQARNNWRLSIGAPIAGTTSEVDPSGVNRIDINNLVLQSRNAKKPLDVHLTNNLDYIIPLNNGRSAQAPSGFVQLAVRSGIKALEGIKVL